MFFIIKTQLLGPFYKEFLKWQASFKTSLTKSLNYKINFLLLLVVPVCVFFAIKYNLWRSIYAVHPEKQIGGYSFSRMIEYQLWILVFELFISRSVFFVENISSDIRLGKISSFLLYPFGFMSHQFVLFLSDKLLQFFIASFCFGLVLVMGWIEFPLILNLLKSLTLILMIGLFWFFVQMSLSFLSFWLEETWSLNLSVRFIATFFSGSILPLDLFPSFLQKLLYWTPFPYLMYFPIQMVMGDEVSFLSCFLVLLIWIFIMFFLAKMIWRKGLKFYTGAGM